MDFSMINVTNLTEPNKTFDLTLGAEPHIKTDFYIKWELLFYCLLLILAYFTAKGYVLAS